VVVARAFESSSNFWSLMTLSSLASSPDVGQGGLADLGDRHPPFRAQRRFSER
jgi:hypothetical protein